MWSMRLWSMRLWPVFMCLCVVSSSSPANNLELTEEFTIIRLPLNGSKTTVKCSDDHNIDFSWLINSVPARSSSNYKVDVVPKSSGGAEGTVSFVPTLARNNTNLTCLVYDMAGLSSANYSAILIIEDVPQPPSPSISVTNDQIAYVSWVPPYSGVVYHITGYHITLMMTNGITVRRFLGNTSLSFNYTLNYTLSECTYITVSLSAENMVGSSSPGIVTQLLPRVLGELQLDTRITYTSDNQPHIRTSFILPEFCESSNATYFLLLFNEEDKVVFTSMESKGSHSGAETSIIVPEDVVKTDSRYKIVIVVRTAEGSRNASQNIDTTRTGSRSTDSKPGGLRPGISSNYYILAGAGFIVLLVLIVLIVAGILCLKRKIKSRKKVCSETVLTRMVSNPVYDTQTSAIYDEIPYSSNGFLPANLVDEGYTSVSTTPEQVRAPTSTIKTSSQAEGEEEYTEMKPAGTVLPRLSLLSESNTTMVDHAERSRTTSINNRPENQYHFE